MGSAIVVVIPDDIDPEDAAADVSALLGLDASVIGWPPEVGEVVGLVDPT